MAWDLVFSPLSLLVFGLGLFLLMMVGGILIQGLEVAATTVSYANLAGIGNGTDTNTGQPVNQALADAIAKIVPVNNLSSAVVSYPPSPGTVGVGQLLVNVQTGYNTNEVLTTVEYGFSIPLTGLAGYTPQAIPIYLQIAFQAGS